MSAIKGTNKQLEEQKQNRKALKPLIEKIKSHWQDLPISEKSLSPPTSQCVCSFYARFCAEYEKILSDIKINILKLESQGESVNKHVYSEEINLAIQLKKICQHIDIFPTCLNDVCEPSPRRTFLLFSMLMNFLSFLVSNTGYANEIIEVQEKQGSIQQEYNIKQQAIGDIQTWNIEDANLNDELKIIERDIENISGEYRNILKQKPEKDLKYKKTIEQINELKVNIGSMNDDLLTLKEDHSNLEKQIVQEFEIIELNDKISTFTDKFKNLEINSSDVESGLDFQTEKIKVFKCSLEQVQSLDFNSDHDDAKSCKEKHTAANNILKEFDSKVVEINKMKSEEAEMLETKTKSQKDLEIIKIKILKQQSESENKLIKLSEKNVQDHKIYEKYSKILAEIQDMSSCQKRDISFLKYEVKERYKNLIKNQSSVYNKFNEALIRLNCHQEELDENGVSS